VDQFLLWDELSDAEKDQMMSGLDEEPQPITAEERRDWVASFDGVCISSDAFFPFRDSLDRASRTNVRYIVQPGGSSRDDLVTEAANQYGMVMAHSGVRLFLH
jgi:AICAR transformylase/IMP cyclohydrolase PurH